MAMISSLEELSDGYFFTLNSMTRAIVKEKKLFASLLGDQWGVLTIEEQDALLEDHFISTCIKNKYSSRSKNVVYPDELSEDILHLLNVKPGQKIVDDEGEVWSDEHSAPFSWKTSSMIDLSINEEQKVKSKDPKRPKSPKALMKSTSSDCSKPDSLERAGSTDFQQLRSIWESHHGTSTLGDLPATGSLSSASLSGCSDAAFAVKSSAAEETEEKESMGPDLVEAVMLEQFDKGEELRGSFRSTKTTSSATSRDYHEGGSNSTTEVGEEDRLSISSQYDNIQGASTSRGLARPDAVEPGTDDILKKFGVTFSYGDEEPHPPDHSTLLSTSAVSYRALSSREQKNEDGLRVESPTLPKEFDFLASW